MATLPALRATTDDPLAARTAALAVPVFKGDIEAPGAEAALRAVGLDGVPRDAGFTGALGDVRSLGAPGLGVERLVLVGLGRMDALSDEALRRAGGALTRAIGAEVDDITTTLPLVHPTEEAFRAVAEGVLLGAYRYQGYRRSRPPRLRRVDLAVPSAFADEATDLLRRAEVHAAAQCTTRDLVNTPAGQLGPEDLVRRAAEVAGGTCDVESWDERRLEQERCGGILAVGQGAERPPRLLVLRYRPDGAVARIALVGKGIVFDTGGLNLKRPADRMPAMKADMAGAAAVIATCAALADLNVAVEVVGVCALAENAVSGRAQRPGDVVTTRDGTTVEVLDTDAEGRLVLADALAYAVEHDLDGVVDVATLTGAAAHAVGRRATAAFGDDEDLLRQLLAAAEAAGEATWRLPMWTELEDNLDSDVADLNNTGDGDHDDRAGATMGALFLRRFVRGVPWVHLDIPSAWAETARYHLPQGGTGTGARTLLRWLELASPVRPGPSRHAPRSARR
ncbi:MAG: leucyl aminopeptidase [Actinomycetota bacterium]|nr:leucyl aminopeptidase [Actinomycetota bacterium]